MRNKLLTLSAAMLMAIGSSSYATDELLTGTLEIDGDISVDLDPTCFLTDVASLVDSAATTGIIGLDSPASFDDSGAGSKDIDAANLKMQIKANDALATDHGGTQKKYRAVQRVARSHEVYCMGNNTDTIKFSYNQDSDSHPGVQIYVGDKTTMATVVSKQLNNTDDVSDQELVVPAPVLRADSFNELTAVSSVSFTISAN